MTWQNWYGFWLFLFRTVTLILTGSRSCLEPSPVIWCLVAEFQEASYENMFLPHVNSTRKSSPPLPEREVITHDRVLTGGVAHRHCRFSPFDRYVARKTAVSVNILNIYIFRLCRLCIHIVQFDILRFGCCMQTIKLFSDYFQTYSWE